jgi:GNAT superfamily N-acetyltransferase
MPTDGATILRSARAGDGAAVFEVTRRAIGALAKEHYSPEQIDRWMGERTPVFYEALIAGGRMVVADRAGVVIGFVDAEPGELTRLFVLPEVAGAGLGVRLLKVGVETARVGRRGLIRVEATLNAESFYRRNGFRKIGVADFSHGLGGPRIEIVLMEG